MNIFIPQFWKPKTRADFLKANTIVLEGHIEGLLFDADGNLILTRRHHNIITNVGRSHIIDRLQAASPAVMDYLAIGTGATAAAAGDTALQTEVARAQGTLSQPDAYTDRLVYTYAAGTGTGSITEAGRLNAASVGDLGCRSVFTAIPKGASDSLQFTYDRTYAAS